MRGAEFNPSVNVTLSLASPPWTSPSESDAGGSRMRSLRRREVVRLVSGRGRGMRRGKTTRMSDQREGGREVSSSGELNTWVKAWEDSLTSKKFTSVAIE